MTSITIFLNVLLLSLTTTNIQARNNLNTNKLRENVLLIIIDDLRHLTGKNVKLPTIEKMAANGITFENAFAQQALCAPSRNSMLTGRRPDSLRLYDFYSYWRDSVGNFTTLPQLFKQNGYDTYSVGKIFHPGASSNFSDDFPYSWTEEPYHPTTDKYKDAAVCKDKITNKLQKNLICPVDVISQPDHTLPDLQTLDYAVNILQERRNKSRPFLLAVGFHKPHIPLKYPQEYLDRVPIDKIRPPKHPNLPKTMPTVAWHPWTDVRHRDDIARLNISFPFGTMPHEWTLKIIQSYYAAAIYVDDLIESLMQHVDLKNTVVVLTSDHGWSLGENGLWAKYSNFDVALKVPLIFLIPGTKPNTISFPVELIDIFPTLAEITGLGEDIPKCTKNTDILCFEGKSLLDLATQTENDTDEEYFVISQYPRPSVYPTKNSDKPKLKNIKIMGYSIRTNNYRYTEWVSFNHTLFTKDWNKLYGLELYDHTTDPYEAYNVVSKRKYRRIRKHLSKLLSATCTIPLTRG
ncbi:iduronate 2-sulfatase [Cydia strobilella]|uniref:iduronate 2-sulfatase n=1 Tax=Cydia strobilella TaxID=1100964 RepID=UPI003003CF08